MKYRRILLITDLAADSRGVLASIRQTVPGAELLVVLACLPMRKLSWFGHEAPPDTERTAHAALDTLRAEAADVAATVDVRLVPDPDVEAIDEFAAASAIDLVVAGSFSFGASLPLGGISILTELRKRRSLPLLWVPGSVIPDPAGPAAQRRAIELVCVAIGRRASITVAAFLRDHGDPAQHVTVLLPGTAVPRDLSAALDVAGIRAAVELVAATGVSRTQWIEERIRANAVDLLVFAHLPLARLLSPESRVPCLVLPPPPPVGRPLTELALDGPDLVALGGPLRTRFEYAVGIGRRTPVPDQALALVSGGRVVAKLGARDGETHWPDDGRTQTYGVFRIEGGDASRPLAAVELELAVLRPGSVPLVLFDAELADAELSALHGIAAQETDSRPALLAVRLRPTPSSRHLIGQARPHRGCSCLDQRVELAQALSNLCPTRLASMRVWREVNETRATSPWAREPR